ncbi:hypothetical protein C8J57DRAFT_1238857 [Mycena rebaudengoi]|nr:hypothetical protein C8J57DRAFT_1238857 [Mycena rebaudengoi]
MAQDRPQIDARPDFDVPGVFFGPRWLPGITLVWGTVMTLMGLAKTYPELVGVRVGLGAAEAGLFLLPFGIFVTCYSYASACSTALHPRQAHSVAVGNILKIHGVVHCGVYFRSFDVSGFFGHVVVFMRAVVALLRLSQCLTTATIKMSKV